MIPVKVPFFARFYRQQSRAAALRRVEPLSKSVKYKKKGEHDMRAEIKDFVVELLESYNDRERKIAVLRYELEHPMRVSQEEMIGAMNFAHGDGINRAGGKVPDKTLHIALNYRGETEKVNAETTREIARRLTELEQMQERLEYYVALLERRHAEVLRAFYFERRSWDEIAGALGVALRTAHKIRGRAIEELAEMYAFSKNAG